MYEIRKNIPVKQTGGQVTSSSTNDPNESELELEKILNKVLKKESLPSLTIDDVNSITKLGSFKKLNSVQKDFAFNKMMEFVVKNDPVSTTNTSEGGNKETPNKTEKNIAGAYFLCKNCGYNEPIEEGTLIVSRTSTESSHEFIEHGNYKDMIHINTLPITRRYICANDKCESHNDHKKREAVFFRVDGTYRVRYVCKTCQTSWI
jgi:hypothetical protein